MLIGVSYVAWHRPATRSLRCKMGKVVVICSKFEVSAEKTELPPNLTPKTKNYKIISICD